MVSNLDLAVIVLYLAATLIIGVGAARRQHLEGFLTNNRNTKLALLSFSNIATLVGAGAVVSVASAAYSSGMSFGILAIVSTTIGVVLLAVIAPKVKAFGDTHKAHTIGDFMMHRYGRAPGYSIKGWGIIFYNSTL